MCARVEFKFVLASSAQQTHLELFVENDIGFVRIERLEDEHTFAIVFEDIWPKKKKGEAKC